MAISKASVTDTGNAQMKSRVIVWKGIDGDLIGCMDP